MKATALFERVHSALVATGMPFEVAEDAASFAVRPVPETTAVLDLEATGDGDVVLFAEVILLEGTSDDWRASSALSRWSRDQSFVKFCRYPDGRLTARAEMLAAYVEPLDLSVTVWALHDAVARTEEAQELLGGTPAQGASVTFDTEHRRAVVPSIPTDTVIRRVRGFLTELGTSFEERDGRFAVEMPTSSAVGVVPSADGRTVTLGAVVAAGIDPWNVGVGQVISMNADLGFAALSVIEDDRLVVVEHDLLASTLSRDELGVVVRYTATAAAGLSPYLTEALHPSVRGAVKAAKHYLEEQKRTGRD